MLPFDNIVVVGRVLGSQLPDELSSTRSIEPDRAYRLATDDFAAEKWRKQGLEFSEDGPLVRDVVLDWVKAKAHF